MKIEIRLPKSRINPGQLDLLSDGGSVLLRVPCLGKADNYRAGKEGNPSRNPLKPWGDTPTGDYLPASVEHLDPPHEHMGTLRVALKGIDGDALCAMGERTDLYIHGGRGNISLVPTFGCVRLLDYDMGKLSELLGADSASIAIIEIADPQPQKTETASVVKNQRV